MVRGSQFDISDMGAVTWAEVGVPPCGINDLRQAALVRIVELSIFSGDEIVFDLDTHTVCGMNLTICQISSRWRRFLPEVPRHTNVTIKMTTGEVTTDFDDFGALNDLVYQPPSSPDLWGITINVFQEVISNGLYDHPSTTIVLNFDIATAASLDDIRINIKNLVPTITMSGFLSHARIRFVLHCPWGSHVHQEEAIVILEDMQKRLSLLLADVLKQRPADLPKVQRMQLPDIWLNGRGALISASYPASIKSSAYSVAYRHERLSVAEIQCRGYRMAMSGEYDTNTLRGRGIHGQHRGSEVIKCWENIRRRHWADPGSKRT
jgi:hypothetical protein